MSTMQIQHLKAFHVVAQELSFTRAAVHLHCAQSTVTAQIQQLERTLGAELFLRRGRNQIELTEAGALLESRAAAILRALEDAQQDISRLQDERAARPAAPRSLRAPATAVAVF